MKTKRIPRALRKAIVTALIEAKSDGPLTAAQLAPRVNAQPGLPPKMQKNARQMSYILRQMTAPSAGSDTPVARVTLGPNGHSRHGKKRSHTGFVATIDNAEEDPALIPRPTRKPVTIYLDDECVKYLSEFKTQTGFAPGPCIERLIKTDIHANGMPGAGVEAVMASKTESERDEFVANGEQAPKLDEPCDCSGRTYPLTATAYILCIECGRQYPMRA